MYVGDTLNLNFKEIKNKTDIKKLIDLQHVFCFSYQGHAYCIYEYRNNMIFALDNSSCTKHGLSKFSPHTLIHQAHNICIEMSCPLFSTLN